MRVALKNQRRNEKIVGSNNPSVIQSTQSTSNRENNNRYQRLRVNSGVPFLRAGTGTGAGGNVDFRNQRNTSNMSRGGTTTTNGRLSTMLNNSSSKKMQTTKS